MASSADSCLGSSSRTLIVGMGNPILTDDAIGVLLARDIAARIPPREDLELLEECSAGGLNLMELFEGYGRAIVIDSIRTRGARTGDWYHFSACALRETMNLSNIHDANFATAMELGRRMGMRLPADKEIHIFAVEVENNLEFGETLSPHLAREYPSLLCDIHEEINEILGTETSNNQGAIPWTNKTASPPPRKPESNSPSAGRFSPAGTQT